MLPAAGLRAGSFNRYTTPVIIALQILLINQPSHAANCKGYQDRIEHYEQLRHKGGKAKQMNHWQTTIDDLEDKLKQCNSANRIRVAFGATTRRNTKSTYRDIEMPVTFATNIQDPTPATTDIVMVRKLKDCIKPNNLIDNEVSECMKGNLKPEWIK